MVTMNGERTGTTYPMISDVPASPVQVRLDRLSVGQMWVRRRLRRYVVSMVDSRCGEVTELESFASRSWAQASFLGHSNEIFFKLHVQADVTAMRIELERRRARRRREGMTLTDVAEHVRHEGTRSTEELLAEVRRAGERARREGTAR